MEAAGAAIAADAVHGLVEPMATSIGGDLLAMIVEPDGTIYDLSSIKAVCARGNAGAVAVQITGSMKQKNYTGHVTLMK